MVNTAHAERITVPFILSQKKSTRKLAALTAYDATFARIIDSAGVDIILVGDSLGCVIQGGETTLPVTLDEMIYHCRCVTRGASRALVVGDLPFMSYQASVEDGVKAAGRLIKEGGVSAVKLEGGLAAAPIISKLAAFDIPVMGHVGLTPQSYHRMGGHKVQGRVHSRDGEALPAGSWERVLADAKAVEGAGAFAIVLEGIPAELASEITEAVEVPTIGVGAGPACDGQILVSYDLLGLIEGSPKFVKQYANLARVVEEAVGSYISEVRSSVFPDSAHSFGAQAQKKVSLVR